ncbi:MAG: MerR family DNA-binding transcriptional regulator [Planctomycetota bacterium]
MFRHFKPKKLYGVAEILRVLGENNIKVSRQTIHNYTMMGLIAESERTPAGHRLYNEGVFEQLRKIEMLKRHHTLKEIKEMLAAKKKS